MADLIIDEDNIYSYATAINPQSRQEEYKNTCTRCKRHTESTGPWGLCSVCSIEEDGPLKGFGDDMDDNSESSYYDNPNWSSD